MKVENISLGSVIPNEWKTTDGPKRFEIGHHPKKETRKATQELQEGCRRSNDKEKTSRSRLAELETREMNAILT